MDMPNLIEKAQKEGMYYEKEILCWLQNRRDILIRKGIGASDVKVPVNYLYAIEKIADNAKIPFYYICDSCFSIALTYSALLKHERER